MKRSVFNILGILFSVAVPMATTLCYFPFWISRGATETVSGLCALLLVLCALPLLNLLKKKLETPSLPLAWGILFVVMRSLSAIIDEVTVISFVGLLSNLVGAIFFRLAKEGVK